MRAAERAFTAAAEEFKKAVSGAEEVWKKQRELKKEDEGKGWKVVGERYRRLRKKKIIR